MEYKKYNKKELLNIIREIGIVFVETTLGEYYIISKNDIADFIMLETERKGHSISMKINMPELPYPVITTNGCFLDRANEVLREEIIDRLVLLQTTDLKPKQVKVIDSDMFYSLTNEEKGIDEEGNIILFDKLYKKYAISQEKHIKSLKQSPLGRNYF